MWKEGVSQQVYDEESMLKQLLGLKGRHIQADAFA